MLRHDNLLFLDEPTNHLDIESREVLEEALLDFDGTLVCVSHDRYLINRLATVILYFENGTLKDNRETTTTTLPRGILGLKSPPAAKRRSLIIKETICKESRRQPKKENAKLTLRAARSRSPQRKRQKEIKRSLTATACRPIMKS